MSASSSQSEYLTPPYTFGKPWPDFNKGITYNDIVKSVDSNKTLIDFYSSKYRNSAPFEGWLQRINNGQISIDGAVVTDPHYALRVGCELVYCRLPWQEPDTPYLLEVLYEDDHLVAINKPSGLQVLPGGLFQQRTVLRQLQMHMWKQNLCTNAEQELHPAPVHRLGRGTSGILLCAKSKQAKTLLSAYFAKGTLIVNSSTSSNASEYCNTRGRGISKFYRALATGIIVKDVVVIEQPIGVMHYPGVATGLYVACPSGKSALSKVRVLERDLIANKTRVEVEIQSGRPHQIRIHLAFIGHPLVGDPLYDVGGKPKLCDTPCCNKFADDGGYEKPTRPVPGDCGYHLHAHRVVFCHPSTHELVEITAPLPSILQTQDELSIGT